jgi:hypothetical protein
VRVTAKIVPEHTILSARGGKDNRRMWRVTEDDLAAYLERAYTETQERIAAGSVESSAGQDEN